MATPRSKKKAILVPIDKPVVELAGASNKPKSHITKPFRGDYRQTAILIKIGKEGALIAIRESKALGLEITYMEKGVIIKEDANGVKVNVSGTPTKGKKTRVKGSHIPKGTILHER
jgi:hypothetical protein